MRRTSVFAGLVDHLRVHGRVVVPIGVTVLVGFVVLGLVVGLYAQLLGAVAYARLVEIASTPESTSALTIGLLSPILLLAVLASLVWAGTAVQVANAAAASRRVSTGSAALVALRRVPRAIAVAVIAFTAVVLAVVATPVLVVVGLVGLAGSRFVERGPSRSTLATMAVPLGVAVRLLLRWSLALPSVWLAGTTVRGALADSAQRSAGRTLRIALTLVLSVVLTLGATEGLVALVASIAPGSTAEFVARLVALILVGPLLLVGLTLHYRAGGDAPPAARAIVPARARRSRTAVAVIVSLVIPMLVSANPAPAAAAGVGDVDFVINTVEAEPLPVGAPTTLVFSVRDAHSAEVQQPTGDITISVDGTPLAGTFTLIGDGSGIQVPYTFTAGSHLIEAVYPGDATFEAAVAELTVQAGTPPPPVATTTAFTITPGSISPAGATLTAHVTVTANEGTNTPTGTVGIYLDDQSEPPLAEQPLVAGSADLEFVLPPGANYLLVYFTGDAGFQNSHIDETQYVGRFTPTVALSAPPGSVTGESFALTATVTAGVPPTGTVTFEATPTAGPPVSFGPAPLDGAGIATATASGLALGDYSIVAHYSGDASVTAADSAASPHTAATAGVDVTVASSIATPAFGSTTLLTVTVAPTAPATGTPTGSVTVTSDDGAVYGPSTLSFAGTVAFPASVGDAGERTFTASYSGDAHFEPGGGSLELDVERAATTTTLAPVPGPGTEYGDEVTFSGTVASTSSPAVAGTVQLWAGAQQVASAPLFAGSFTISTDRVPAGSAVTVWAVYVPDANHEPSESARQAMEVAKAQPALVLSANDTTPTIGDTITLTADLTDLGAGPSGTVTFTNLTTDPDVVLGSPTIVGHTATLDVVVTAVTMQIVASYAGDGNFYSESTSMLTVTADRVTPTVTLEPVGAVEYGTLVTLEATVTPAGLDPIGGVQFRSAAGTIATVVPDAAGRATLQACAGDAGACPGASVFLGSGALSLTARYMASTVAYEADSAPVAYSVTPAATTTTVSVNPTVVDPGAGIYLTATIAGVSSGATPQGDVTFYASMPDGMGGFGSSFIATQALDASGAATVFVTAGTGPTDIRWPAAAITAQYFPIPNTKFASSSGSTPVTVDRYDVTLSGTPPLSAMPGVPATVSVGLTHEPGTSAPFTGTLTITPDVGSPCTLTLPVTPPASCAFTWAAAGAHSFTASYSGDLVYEPATLAPVTVNVGVGTPNFVPLAPLTAVAETDVTVNWNSIAAGATGTVTVWGDGTLWCTTPLATLSCTGQFGVGSATGSPVDLVIRYSGDASWGPAEVIKPVTVARCVVPDVTSANPSLGTVHISTPSNCGVGGYLTGTPVTATAQPISPNVFVAWKKLGGAGLVTDTTTLATMFTITTDSTTWVRVASFSPPCYPVTVAATGRGSASIYPATNCTTLGGVAGYALGTSIAVYPDPLLNAHYGELDAFYSFGAVAGGSVGSDSAGRVRLVTTVTGATSIPITFGPQCRPVRVVFSPASPGDESSTPAANCTSPQATGFLRYSSVTVKAVSGDPTLAIASWSLNGIAKPDWGTRSEQTVEVGTAAPVLTAHLVHCYTLTVKTDNTQDLRAREVGKVAVDTEPNCPDGSDRYLAGTKVTLTPEILVEGAAFNGWDSARIKPESAPGGVGPVTSEAKVVTMTADITITAGFYSTETCSTLRVIDNIDIEKRPIVTIAEDGCGPGQYFDLQKQQAGRVDEEPANLWSDSDRSDLRLTVNPAIKLDVYVSVRGDTGTCFDGRIPTGPTADTDSWKTYGPLTGEAQCAIGGDIDLQVASCQSIDSTMTMVAADDPTGTPYGRTYLPDNLLMPGPDGMVGPLDLNEFDWMMTAPVYAQNGELMIADLGDDPCTRAASNLYPAGRDIGLFGFGPTSGFTAAGWAEVGAQNPVITKTTNTAPTQTVYPVFEVECHTLAFGRGITVIGDPAYCPGSKASDNSFIAGTAVTVKAAQVADDRILHGFTIGVVAKQVFEDEKSGALTAFVVVDADKSVRADYPTKTEAVGRAIVQGLKISVGILAVLAPIGLGMIFPPAGIFFAFLGAAAGIVNLIPHGKEVAGVLDLINPTKITTCAAQWGFSNTGNPSGGLNPGSILSAANTGRKLYKGVEVMFEKVGKFGAAGAVAGTALGLYSAGIAHAELGVQTVEQLAGTSTMTGCLDNQWHVVGSNISGN